MIDYDKILNYWNRQELTGSALTMLKDFNESMVDAKQKMYNYSKGNTKTSKLIEELKDCLIDNDVCLCTDEKPGCDVCHLIYKCENL